MIYFAIYIALAVTMLLFMATQYSNQEITAMTGKEARTYILALPAIATAFFWAICQLVSAI